MKEYTRLEEEKARWHGKVYNWETAKYGKIWYDEDGHDLRSIETEFPAILLTTNYHLKKHSLVNPCVLSLFPSWSLVSAGTNMSYLPGWIQRIRCQNSNL
nr:hypothetical protein [Tanacetum cinerariifolium]